MTKTHLITPIEASDILTLTIAQLRKLVRDRALPHVMLPGGELRFDEHELRKWVERHKRGEVLRAD